MTDVHNLSSNTIQQLVSRKCFPKTEVSARLTETDTRSHRGSSSDWN